MASDVVVCQCSHRYDVAHQEDVKLHQSCTISSKNQKLLEYPSPLQLLKKINKMFKRVQHPFYYQKRSPRILISDDILHARDGCEQIKFLRLRPCHFCGSEVCQVHITWEPEQMKIMERNGLLICLVCFDRLPVF